MRVFIIKEEETKAELDPNPNAYATFCVLLKYNAWDTTRRVFVKYNAWGFLLEENAQGIPCRCQ